MLETVDPRETYPEPARSDKLRLIDVSTRGEGSAPLPRRGSMKPISTQSPALRPQ
jgi:hypothetical protein